MKTGNVVAIEKLETEEKETKAKTDKKYLNRADKIVRRLDNALTELVKIQQDARELESQTEIPSTEVNDKDYDRITEVADVLEGATKILYHLCARMSRKYVGKEIEPIDQSKRKSLKEK
jgi:hypothetical protein